MTRKYHRVGFTVAQSAELWERWRKGESLNAIGRKFGKPSSCIFNRIRPTGGISPVPRHHSQRALTLGGAQTSRRRRLSVARPSKLVRRSGTQNFSYDLPGQILPSGETQGETSSLSPAFTQAPAIFTDIKLPNNLTVTTTAAPGHRHCRGSVFRLRLGLPEQPLPPFRSVPSRMCSRLPPGPPSRLHRRPASWPVGRRSL